MGVHASRHDTKMVSFLGTLTHCTISFHVLRRLGKVKECCFAGLKTEAETRWSSRTEAVKPIQLYLEKIVLLLENVVEDDSQTMNTQSDGQ